MKPITLLEAPAAVWAHAFGFAGKGRGKTVRRIYAVTLIPVMVLYVIWMFPRIYRLDRNSYAQIRARGTGPGPRRLILVCAPLLLTLLRPTWAIAAGFVFVLPLYLVMRRKPNRAKAPDADWKVGTLVNIGAGTGGLLAATQLLRTLATPGQTVGILAATPALRDLYVKRYGFVPVTHGSLELLATIT